MFDQRQLYKASGSQRPQNKRGYITMTNTVELKRKDGSKNTTGINPDCTMKEVMEFYSDNNFLSNEENQVVEITFFKGFKDMFAGCREHTVVAYYNDNVECYLF